MRPRHGFTLLELIVVAAILVLLAGLLVPALAGVRQNGRVAADLSNLRSLQQAHLMYANEHRLQMIDVGLPHNNIPNEDAAWFNTMRQYYDSENLLRSPLDDSPHWPADRDGEGIPVPGTNDRFRRTSYGCNNYLTSYNDDFALSGDPADLFERVSSVPSPAATVHFLIMVFTDDDGFCGSDHVHAGGWWNDFAGDDFPARKAASEMQTNAAGGKAASWTARSNYGFLDGHVETLEFNQVYVNRELNRFDPDVSGSYGARRNVNP